MITFFHEIEDLGLRIIFDAEGDFVECLYDAPEIGVELNITAEMQAKKDQIETVRPEFRTGDQNLWLSKIEEWFWQARYEALEAAKEDFDKDFLPGRGA